MWSTRKNFNYYFFILFLFIVCWPTFLNVAKPGIVFFSYNTQHLGWGGDEKNLAIKQVISRFKSARRFNCQPCLYIMAYQEVHGPKGLGPDKIYWSKKGLLAISISGEVPWKFLDIQEINLGEKNRPLLVLFINTVFDQKKWAIGNVHWPSQFNSFERRLSAAEKTLAFQKNFLATNKTKLIMMGDFNLIRSERIFLEATGWKFFVPKGSGSYFYSKKMEWNAFDLFWGLSHKAQPQIYNPIEFSTLMKGKEGKYLWVPRPFDGQKQKGFSDHYAIYWQHNYFLE